MRAKHRRFLGILKSPQPANEKESIYKIIVAEIKNEGTDELDEQGWIPLSNPPETARDLLS